MKLILQYTKYILFVLPFAFTLTSCEIINPSEEIPFYLRIDSISFIDSTKSPACPAKKGSQNIQDAWVFVDGILVGNFELPAEFPVLAKAGAHTVRVSPGVVVNTLSDDRRIYPFFNSYPLAIDVELGKTYTIKPQCADDPVSIKYPSEGSGQFPEGFEGIGTIFRYTPNSKVDSILRTSNSDLVFDGNFSMLMEMNSADDYMEFETVKEYTLPSNTRPVYLEFNYRTDVSLNIGFYATNNNTNEVSDVNFITLLPTNDSWKKVYLSFGSILSRYSNSKYRFYFKARHDSGRTTSKVLLDNVRLIYK